MRVAKEAGRHGRPWRRVRASVLARSTVCWLCGHGGADSVDHIIPRAVAIAMGEHRLLNDEANLAPAHHQPCPDCGVRCNRKRGTGTAKPSTPLQSRPW